MKHYEEGAAWYDLVSQGFPGELGFYLKEAKKANGKVLEAACGTGRIYLELLEGGVNAYGFDLSNDMLRVLKDKAKGRGLEPKVKLADMRTFNYPNKFDLIMIPYNSFLHLETREDQKKCLMNVRKHLKKGGRLILGIFDPRIDYLAKVDRKTETSVLDKKSGKRIKMENFSHYDYFNQHIYSFHRLINPPKGLPREKIEFTCTYIFPREFMNMLELCGFRKWKIYGGFDYEPYIKHGQNLVWIAYK
jgi:SAM-dependent methyltransferase